MGAVDEGWGVGWVLVLPEILVLDAEEEERVRRLIDRLAFI